MRTLVDFPLSLAGRQEQKERQERQVLKHFWELGAVANCEADNNLQEQVEDKLKIPI